MKYGIIWWWNTLCYKNNRRRLTKASVDSGFKNSCPKSCLDHWILKPLKLWERARTGILYQAQFWPRQEDGTEVTGFTLLPSLPSWTKEWRQCWSRWHSPSCSEPGQTSDLQQAMKDHFQTQVGLCGILNKWSSPSVITSCQLQHKQNHSQSRVTNDRDVCGSGRRTGSAGLNFWQAKNNLLLWERWLSGSVPLREAPRPCSQGTSSY